jgi:hypothetical protein
MTDETCQHCRFWQTDLDEGLVHPDEDRRPSGSCRRYPPHAPHTWPWTNADEWCGEFQLKASSHQPGCGVHLQARERAKP